MKKIGLLVLIFLQTFFTAKAQKNADDIIGVWETGNGKARVKITKVNDFYFGRIVWLKEPLNEEGKPKVDKNNEDESKRQNRVLGMQLVGGFAWKGNNLWEDGTIYDPESGKTYNCKISLEDNNTMDIRGFIGISVFGRTDKWKRLKLK